MSGPALRKADVLATRLISAVLLYDHFSLFPRNNIPHTGLCVRNAHAMDVKMLNVQQICVTLQRQSIEMHDLYLPSSIDLSNIQNIPDLSNKSHISRGCDELDAAMHVPHRFHNYFSKLR